LCHVVLLTLQILDNPETMVFFNRPNVRYETYNSDKFIYNIRIVGKYIHPNLFVRAIETCTKASWSNLFRWTWNRWLHRCSDLGQTFIRQLHVFCPYGHSYSQRLLMLMLRLIATLNHKPIEPWTIWTIKTNTIRLTNWIINRLNH
jgi:hypothetical protein